VDVSHLGRGVLVEQRAVERERDLVRPGVGRTTLDRPVVDVRRLVGPHLVQRRLVSGFLELTARRRAAAGPGVSTRPGGCRS
jgi:hypothetical protein